MRAMIVLVGCAALFAASGIAVAAPPGQRVGPAPKAAPAHAAAHNKASSFAPHPTKRRTFGAPIQAPIMKHVAPKKKKPAPK